MNDIILRQKKIRWFYLGVGVVVLLFLGLIYAWSVFRSPLEAEFGWSKAETSVTFSISMMMFCIGGLVSGLITGKRRGNLTLSICALCIASGFLLASRINSLMGIYIAYGCFCGFGTGLGYNAVLSKMIKWFPDKQGLVSGISLMGFGLGGMILGTIGARLIMAFGWRTTFVIIGLSFAVVVFLGAFLLKDAPKEFLDSFSSKGQKTTASLEEISFKQMLKRRNFQFYFIWSVFLSAAGLGIINESAVYAANFVNGDLVRAAAVAGIVSIFNGIGRVVFGQLFDMKGYKIAMIGVCLLYMIGAGMLGLSYKTESLAVLVTAFVIIGLAFGGVPPINSAFTAHFFGRQNYPLNFSIVNLVIVFAAYLGPMCGSRSYLTLFACIFGFALLGTIIVFAIPEKVRESCE